MKKRNKYIAVFVLVFCCFNLSLSQSHGKSDTLKNLRQLYFDKTDKFYEGGIEMQSLNELLENNTRYSIELVKEFYKSDIKLDTNLSFSFNFQNNSLVVSSKDVEVLNYKLIYEIDSSDVDDADIYMELLSSSGKEKHIYKVFFLKDNFFLVKEYWLKGKRDNREKLKRVILFREDE